MRKYDVNGKIEILKTLPSEIKLSEFVKISTTKDGQPRLDYNYYLDMFGVLGLSEEFLDKMDIKTLVEVIKDFQEDFQSPKEYVREFEIDGKKYTAFQEGEEFELKAREFAQIEARMKNNGSDWITYALAVIFKKENTPVSESKSEAHIKFKQVNFKDLTMDICLPYIMLMSQAYIGTIQSLAQTGDRAGQESILDNLK